MSKLIKSATFGLERKVKGMFFDRPKVKLLTDEATRKGIGGACAYIRTVAINSMRRDKTKKQNPSKPGQPPKFRASNESASLRNIQFFYDEANKTGIVGPIKLNGTSVDSNGIASQGVVPAVHEFGGSQGIREKLLPFSLAVAYKLYGRAIAEQIKQNGGTISEDDANRIYGKEAKHRVDKAAGGVWIPFGQRKRNRIIIRTRKAVYPKRPFMSSALSKAVQRGKIPQAFGGRVGTT